MMMQRSAFFRPEHGWVGDVIPFSSGDECRLYYLHDVRADPKPGMPWHLLTTRDGVTFADRGEAFAAGGEQDADFNAYTGSIVTDGAGVHHLFYTGQNPRILGLDGRPLQVVMHATSSGDTEHWQRHPEHAFGAFEGYETGDWRDPFVFRDEENGLWRMLLAARHTEGPERRRGVIAQCVSTDLVNWEAAEPFWDPRRYITHECPEVFKMGDWWYLVYSEFSEAFTTRYRMSRDLAGPWLVPEFDSIDGRAFYASKSAMVDGERMLFGWIATKEEEHDAGAWQWAGTLAVLQVTQRADGTLDFSMVPGLLETFSQPVALNWVSPELPEATASAPDGDLLVSPDSYRSMLSEEPVPDQCRLSVEFEIEEGTVECGVLLRSCADGDKGYAIRLEPKRQRMVFDRWPRTLTGSEQWQISGDVPYAIELERPVPLGPGRHTLEVVLDGDICVVTFDGRVALSTRIYDHASGHAGFFVGEGAVTCRRFEVTTRAEGKEG